MWENGSAVSQFKLHVKLAWRAGVIFAALPGGLATHLMKWMGGENHAKMGGNSWAVGSHHWKTDAIWCKVFQCSMLFSLLIEQCKLWSNKPTQTWRVTTVQQEQKMKPLKTFQPVIQVKQRCCKHPFSGKSSDRHTQRQWTSFQCGGSNYFNAIVALLMNALGPCQCPSPSYFPSKACPCLPHHLMSSASNAFLVSYRTCTSRITTLCRSKLICTYAIVLGGISCLFVEKKYSLFQLRVRVPIRALL